MAHVCAGGKADRLVMNCSGKHAAMLLTCRRNGWDIAGYLDPEHPLQKALRVTVEHLSGGTVEAIGVDGCGAPIFGMPVSALARCFARLAAASVGTPERLVVDALRGHPEVVGGPGRHITRLLRAVPGLVAKDGAEGVYAAALPGGPAVAVKIDDGADRASGVVVAAALVRHGVDGASGLDRLDVMGGQLRPAGPACNLTA